ncbi:MAG: hypothetical protein ACW99F_05930 [Candidatus Hodarchaeales archaeon]
MQALATPTSYSDIDKIPAKRKKNLPDYLKDPYGARISPSDVKLFLGLFGKIENLRNGDKNFYELDAFSEGLHPINHIKKVYREIDSAILGLLKGKTIGDEKENQRKTSHTRSICMLLGLKHLFKETYMKSKKKKNVKAFTNKYDNGDVADVSWADHGPLIDYLHDNSPNIGIGEDRNWFLSYPLLLVQSIRFCQWEFDNHNYCFEFYTAKRARKFLRDRFDKWFELSKKKWTQVNIEYLEKILDIFARMIRWHTLEGQFKRETSEFGIEEIAEMKDWYDIDNEKRMLYAITYADTLVREDRYKYEWEVWKFLAQVSEEGDYLTNNVIKNLELLEISLSADKEKQLLGEIVNGRKEPKKKTEKIIWSFSKPPGVKEGYLEIREKIKDIIKTTKSHTGEKYYNAPLHHFIFNRRQRNIGIIHKIFKQLSQKLTSEMFEVIWINNKLVERGLPDEQVSLIAFHPAFMAKTIYGLDIKETGLEIPPNEFLKIAFNAVLEKYDDKIPLPMVRRITDQLEFYSLKEINEHEPKNDNDHKVFLLRILFDHGKSQIDVWLPEEPPKDSIPLAKENLSVEGLLCRYLNFIVFNYGMTRQFNHVDLDFSASSNFAAGSPHIWRVMMNDPKKSDDCRKNLGLKVFDRYLTDVGIEQLETTFSLEKYQAAIEKRKMINPYVFKKPASILGLEGKYILGIDIGGTGTKIKFFKITQQSRDIQKYYLLSKQPENNDENFKKRKFGPATDYPHKHYYLIPVIYKENKKVKPLEFTMPTRSYSKAKKEGRVVEFENEHDFAAYIIRTLWKRLNTLGKSIHKEDILKNTISLGFCWPGPIKQNKIASTSGILNYFKDFKRSILDNEYHKIVNLDIANAVRDTFQKKRAAIFQDSKKDKEPLTVALENDGDVEAAGLAFGLLNSIDTSSKNSMDIEIKKQYRKLFESYSVGIIKAGTGTAGSVLVQGEIKGLNEFGKLTVDLGADNTKNLKTDEDNRWPVGVANKFFSMKSFQQVMRDAGVREYSKNEITGRDIDLILSLRNTRHIDKLEKIRHFGVLELVSLAEPHIQWDDFFIPNKKKLTFKEDITLKFGEDEAYRIVNKEKSRSKIDPLTWWNLASEPLIESLNLPADKAMSLISARSKKRIRAEDLLSKMGRNRIARLNFKEVAKNKEGIKEGIKNVGNNLADIITLLYDIYNLKCIVISGGAMNSKEIADPCMEGLKEALKTYLYDTFHDEDTLIKRIEYENITNLDELRKYKLLIQCAGENHALLGAAILGLDHYVQEQKVRELQKLAKKKEGKIRDNIRFLTLSEGIKFLRINAGLLKITVDDDGSISKLA